MKEPEFVWKGKILNTFGDIGNAVTACRNRKEAEEFMRLYRQVTPHANKNVGYLSGYYDEKTAEHIRKWFGVTHPIFGDNYPSPKEAFEAGKRLGERKKTR